MTSAEVSTNGSCIWPEPNRSPTVFIPSSRISFTISSAGLLASPSSRSASRPIRPPAVVDQVERRLQLVGGYPGYRHDPGRVHDRRVQPGPHALGQEHRVERG